MTTLAQAVQTIVENSVDQDYLDECGTPGAGAASLQSVFMSEYGNWNGVSPKSCMDYLQGLPTVCTIPFYNSEILELLESQGITRKSEDAKSNLIDMYWKTAGQVLYKMIK